MQHTYDIAILGGGINGCAIAADAAGRGYRVILIEKHDLASGTSSASTKLIHGGLRYLEHFQFRLVRESLAERERLMKITPHLMKPMRFIIPCSKERPYWLLRSGLFLYDYLQRTSLAKTATISLQHQASCPLQSCYDRALAYSDCWIDDSRLVISNALAAKQQGATILTRTLCERAQATVDGWQLQLRCANKTSNNITAKILVNATGPWANQLLTELGLSVPGQLHLVKGSHILLPRLYAGDEAYLLQHTDKRVLFLIPYLDRYTLIGTTEVKLGNMIAKPMITADEINYLCEAVNRYLRQPITAQNIVASYSGVRPLFDESNNGNSQLSRDYQLKHSKYTANSSLLTVYGGKITTYRCLAEAALEYLQHDLPTCSKPWTATAALPGSETDDYQQFAAKFRQRYPWLTANTCQRLLTAYGTRCEMILQQAANLSALGQCFGADLYEREVEYLIKHEWAQTVDDIVWRRTKLGYQLSAVEKQKLTNWLAANNTD